MKIEEVSKGNETLRLPGYAKNTVFINESGLCSLIMRSEKPEATLLDSGLRGLGLCQHEANNSGKSG
jgi:hypothetical protein